jgi:phosphatidylinositol alpha-1,6-mannosyltransferase
MTALFITNDFPPMAGGEATYYSLLCAAVPPDQVVVLAPLLPGADDIDARLPYRIVRRRVPTGPHPAARLAQIAVFLRVAAHLVRRKSIRDVHIGHLHLGLAGLAVKRLLGVPYVLYLHGGEMAAYMRLRPVRAAVRTIVKNARLLVVNSTYTRERYEAMGLRHPRVEVLMPSVGTDRFRPDRDPGAVRQKYDINGDRVILTVGRLVERKGHDMVIRALPAVERAAGPVLYVVAGGGPEERRLRALARDVGCAERVRFIGPISGEDLAALYVACDVFVMPSRALNQRDGVEGFGIVFLEAGACAKPVVGGRSGGIADAVLDGVTGVLVNPTDIAELEGALIRLLRDPAEAQRLGMQGRKRAEALAQSWEPTVRRIFGTPQRAPADHR